MKDLAINYDDVISAARQIKGRAVRTPLLENQVLNKQAGGRVFIKPECLQHTGSFKYRGAYNRISRLTAAERAKGVVAFSSGNHAQGVALAATQLGVKATIVMPADAPMIKMENTQKFGGHVVTYDRYSESREAIAVDIAEKTGAIIVPSYDDPCIMAGQGTIGLEIAEDLQTLGVTPDQALINCGGGGLSSGAFTALKHFFPDMDGYVVEPESYNDTQMSLQAGKICAVDPTRPSVCDALLAASPGHMTFAVLKALDITGLTVSEQEAMQAVRYASGTLKLVGEPGGVVSLAAVLQGRVPLKDRVTVCIISGGNIDPKMLAKALLDYGD